LDVVVFHICSLGSLNKDRLVELCCWWTGQENEQGVFISLSRTSYNIAGTLFPKINY